MYIEKTIIVNIVCSVLVIIRSQVTTDARNKTFGWGLIWCQFSAGESTTFLHPSATALLFFFFFSKYAHES